MTTSYEELREMIQQRKHGQIEMTILGWETFYFRYPFFVVFDFIPYKYLEEYLNEDDWIFDENETPFTLMSEYIDVERLVEENYLKISVLDDDGDLARDPKYFRYESSIGEKDPFGLNDYVLEGKSLPEYITNHL